MMDCVAPEEIEEGDLVAYIDGVAGDNVAAHVLTCAFCQSEVVALRTADAHVAAVAPRAACPPAESLLHYDMGWLDDADRQAIADHLETCAYCPEELALLAAVAPVDVPEAPWWERVVFEGRRLLEAVVQIGGPSLAPALRGDAVAPAVYEAGPFRLVLRSEPPGHLRGRLGDQEDVPVSGAAVRLYAGMEVEAETILDEFGHFAFAGLQPGEYGLALFADDAVIVTTADVF